MLIMVFNKQVSLKKEVFYLAVIFSVIILLVYGFIFSISLFDLSVDSARKTLKETNMQISIFIEGYFSEITRTLEALGENPDIKTYMEGDEITRERVLTLYDNFHQANDNITFIYSGYENGYLLINDYTPPEGYDPRERPWYVAAINKKPETSIGLPYQEANTEEWLISQSRALIDSRGKTRGVIAIDCALEGITSLIKDRHIYDSQRSYILNPEGEVIIHPSEEHIGQTVPGIKEEIDGGQGEFTYTFNGSKTWAYYNTIQSTDWILVTAVDRWEILKPLALHLSLYTLSIIGMAIFLGILQSKIFGKRFAEPLVELGTRISEIAEGKPRKESGYQFSNQEIAEIAANIEQLAEHSLRKKANELETIIESAEGGILVLDNNDQVIYVNSQFKEIWGIDSKNYLTGDYRLFINNLADQIKDPNSFLAKVQKLSGSPHRDRDTLYCKDGRILELFSCPLLNDGQVEGRLWSFSDVTYRKQAEEKLRIMATTDELTGLWNRRYFMEAAEQELKRSWRYGHPFSLITLDIDHFKSINDRFGHGGGDMVLRKLAEIMKEVLRQTDIPGRLGGEEFSALLPNTHLEEGVLVAERLREKIQRTPTEYKGDKIYITVSIGLTGYHKDISSVDELLKKADDALYEAKAGGRNCVVKNES